MPAPVIADTFRVVLQWTLSGTSKTAVNVMHVISETATPAQILEAFEAHVDVNMWDPVCSGAQVDTLSCQQLDGTSAAIEKAPDSPSLWFGQGGTQAIPQGAGLIKMTTGLAGRRNRGRLYLPFLAEGVQENGVIDAAVVTECTEAWVDFANTIASGLGGTEPCALAVASYVGLVSHQVLNLALLPKTATQRRRQSRN